MVGDDAEEWAAALRGDGQPSRHLGARRRCCPAACRPETWCSGWTARTDTTARTGTWPSWSGPTVTVSENSSSRGIGTHAISAAALGTLAGVMRWHQMNGGTDMSVADLLAPSIRRAASRASFWRSQRGDRGRRRAARERIRPTRPTSRRSGSARKPLPRTSPRRSSRRWTPGSCRRRSQPRHHRHRPLLGPDRVAGDANGNLIGVGAVASLGLGVNSVRRQQAEASEFTISLSPPIRTPSPPWRPCMRMRIGVRPCPKLLKRAEADQSEHRQRAA